MGVRVSVLPQIIKEVLSNADTSVFATWL